MHVNNDLRGQGKGCTY